MKRALAYTAAVVKCRAVFLRAHKFMFYGFIFNALPRLSNSHHLSHLLKIAFISMLVLLLSNCASNSDKSKAIRTEQALYEISQKAIKNRDFLLATTLLQRLESDFPFGKYANSSQLSLIYVYYKTADYELADAAASRFIRLHPNHPDVDYAYYMKGLLAFPKEGSVFQSLFKTDRATKNTKDAQRSFVHFSDLTNRFPNSQYTPDATKRLEYLRNLLARSEINIANYYFNRKAYIAALNRGKYVVENFQRTPAVPDGLAIMVQAYMALDMKELADDSLNTLKANFPDYPALKEDGSFNMNYYKQESRSLTGFLTLGLIDFSRPPGFDTRDKYGKY